MKELLTPKIVLIILATSLGVLIPDAKAQDSVQRSSNGAAFYEMDGTKEKIAKLTANGTIDFAKQVSATKFIVRGKSGFDQNLKKKSGYDWKFSAKNWNPKNHFKFIVGHTNRELLQQELLAKGVKFEIQKKGLESSVLRVHSKHDREIVFQSCHVTFIDQADKTPEEETLVNYHDLSVNKINPIHHNTNFGGDGFAISIKEKSFNSEDIDFKGRYFLSPLASSELSVHANFMATIAAGGGNSASNSKGGAWKANISSSDFTNLFPDNAAVLQSAGISVQNHSYGILLESFYGAEAKSYDASIFSNPTLLHVFSAGNSGLLTNLDGTYAGLTSYSTLTGNFKMSKNALVVGGHYRDYTVDSRNSHGPAYDGRIKPEVVAYGEEGTSDAAAIVTGLSVLIQDAYKSAHGVNPTVSLIKASLISAADDIGAVGIDHVNGFGAINGNKSLAIITSSQFEEGNVLNGQTKIFPLNVPANTRKVVVSLVWTDPAAESGDALALINDLDLSIKDPSNNVTLPWVLSSYPHTDSLTTAPKRKRDRINNVELITLENPAQGTYELNVSGFQVLSASQAFSLAWSFEGSDSFSWTYPLPNDMMNNEEEVYLRWENTIDGNGTIEVSIAGGPWQLVEASVPLQNEYYAWTPPDTNAQINLRMNTGISSVETGNFVVSKRFPLKVIYNCENDGMIAWNKMPEATTYQVFALGDEFFEPITTTADTSFAVDKSEITSAFFSVAPIINGESGYRSFAYDIGDQGVNCYYTSFYGFAEDDAAHVYLNLSTLYNVQSVTLEKKTGEGFIPINTVTSLSLILDFIDTEVQRGETIYRASIELLNGDVSTTETITVYYADKNTFMIWPNPIKAGESLTIFTDGNNLSIHFYSSDGRLMESMELIDSLFKPIIRPSMGPGLFFYKILRGKNLVSSGKLMVSN